MSANDFAKAINEESEPESDEELQDALRQAQQNNDDMGQCDLNLFKQLTTHTTVCKTVFLLFTLFSPM